MKTPDTANPNRAIVFYPILFFCLLLPVLAEVSTYHSDEHYYTDSAVYMVQHNDFLTPHYNDGALRTKKPILTYWLIIAGYAVFGVNFFAARLPFLLAGCAMLWLCYRMALQLFKERRVAVLSAVLLASNVQFFMLCLRSTPDILQVLFMNVSLYGFLAVVFNRDCRLRNYIFIYFGAALVVQTKGLLGVVLIGFIWAYYFLARDRSTPPVRIAHWPVMAIAAIVALSWYAYIFLAHGGGALGGFYTDQVGGKISGSKYYILFNVKDYLWGVFRNFLPWSLILASGYAGYRKTIHAALKQHRKPAVFIASWFALMLAIFIGSTDCRTRYLVPAYPLLAILAAFLFWRVFETGGIQRVWKWLCTGVLALLAIGGLGLSWIGAVLQWQVLFAGLILFASSVAAAWGWRRRGILPPAAMGLVLWVALAVPKGFVLPTFEFGPAKSLSACILREHPPGQPITVWSLGRANFLRQLYTLSQGRIQVRYFRRGDLPPHLGNRPIVVLDNDEKQSYQSYDYGVETCGAVFRVPDFSEVWGAMLSGNRDAVYKSMQEPIFLARRRPAANHIPPLP